MKKLLVRALLTVAATATFLGSSLTAEAKRFGEDSLYPQAFIVDEIDEKKDLVYLRTFSGFIYTWEGVEDWMVGDIAAAIMYNSGTEETIVDDQIVTLEYCGYTDQF